MQYAQCPAEDDEDAYVFIDHREEEGWIANAVAERLDSAHRLAVHEDADDGQIELEYAGVRHPVPLQFSPHDRYVMISSLAHLLREHYRFFVLKPSLDSDTHGLLVAPAQAVTTWGAVPDHLEPLELGHDYFHDIRVPYLGGEDAAPEFTADSQRVRDGSAAMGGFVEALFTGKLSDAAAARLAALAARDPAARAADGAKSEAEIAAELQKELDGILRQPDMVADRKALDASLAELRALTGRPAKPWWKLW